jgi:exosortase
MSKFLPIRQSASPVTASPSSAVSSAGTLAEIDEPFLAGCRRRAAAFAAEMREPEQRLAWLVIGILTILLIYSYWPGLLNAQSSWNNPQYSHGWIVPLFAAGLLFWWRQPVQPVTLSARMAGMGLLVGSFALRLWCASYRIVTIDMYTFVPALAGVFLLAGGWKMFRWAWAPIAFLIFMYPLPDEATRYLLGPLQTLATMVSTFALQTLGFDAFREGNQIILGDRHLNVVDACSGLRMLTIFVALSVALVLLGNREWWENAVVIASAVPIALIVNSIRITVTGVMYTIDAELADKIFHDWAGYFMMPLALGMLFFEQQLLSWLVVAEDAAPAVVTASRAGPPPGNPGISRVRKAAEFPSLARPGTGGKVS